MRFTVHRPPGGEVSLCWHRPPGGNATCSVHVGVARGRVAGVAREGRLALAAFGRDMPTGGTSLRRVRCWDLFGSARSFVLKPGNQQTPRVTSDRAVEAPLLRNPHTRVVNRTARGARHRPHIELLHSNSFEPARQVGRRLLHPIPSPIRFPGFELRDRPPGVLPTVGAVRGWRKALLQPAQASDAVGLHARGHRSCPAESNPPDPGHPPAPATPGQLPDMARLHPYLSEAFMDAGLAPRGAAMGTDEEVPDSLCEIPQRLLLYRVRPSRQPAVFGTGLTQLCRLLVVSGDVATRLPTLLLLYCPIPHEPRMSAMLQQHHLLCWCGHQPEPGHTRNVATATDSSRMPAIAQVSTAVPVRQKCRRL